MTCMQKRKQQRLLILYKLDNIDFSRKLWRQDRLWATEEPKPWRYDSANT